MVAFICTESGTDIQEGVFSFCGSRVALKVVQIAGWWLLFAPKVVRTTGRCFSFRGSRVALKVVHIAGWWLLFAPKVVQTSWKVFFFSWFPCGTEGGTDCWMVAFCFHRKWYGPPEGCVSFRGCRVALKVVQIDGW